MSSDLIGNMGIWYFFSTVIFHHEATGINEEELNNFNDQNRLPPLGSGNVKEEHAKLGQIKNADTREST